MSKRVLILDTSVLCCWLKVPGKDEAGPVEDRWNFKRIDDLLKSETTSGSTFVLPIATLIETGNHIAQANDDHRYERAQALALHLRGTADEQSPWAAFTDQSTLWQPDRLRELADTWPALAAARISIGDATIKNVAEHYARASYNVEILTGDEGLKAYQPQMRTAVPRRRGGK
jgi:hypothetical protein